MSAHSVNRKYEKSVLPLMTLLSRRSPQSLFITASSSSFQRRRDLEFEGCGDGFEGCNDGFDGCGGGDGLNDDDFPKDHVFDAPPGKNRSSPKSQDNKQINQKKLLASSTSSSSSTLSFDSSYSFPHQDPIFDLSSPSKSNLFSLTQLMNSRT